MQYWLKLGLLVFVSLLLSSAHAKSVRDYLEESKSCYAADTGSVECTFGKKGDLQFFIAGVGQPDAALEVVAASEDFEHRLLHSVAHGCFYVKKTHKYLRTLPVETGERFATFLEHALVNSKTARVHSDHKSCATEF